MITPEEITGSAMESSWLLLQLATISLPEHC